MWDIKVQIKRMADEFEMSFHLNHVGYKAVASLKAQE